MTDWRADRIGSALWARTAAAAALGPQHDALRAAITAHLRGAA